MNVVINGDPTTFDGSVAELVRERFGDGSPTGIAIAVNDEVVARSRWDTCRLLSGDRVEIVTAVQGG